MIRRPARSRRLTTRGPDRYAARATSGRERRSWMPGGQLFEITLPANPRSAGDARRFLSRALSDIGCEPLADTGTLLVSELVTNAVIHAGTAVRVTVERADPGVRVGVSDDSPVGPRRRNYSAEATTGRGM